MEIRENLHVCRQIKPECNSIADAQVNLNRIEPPHVDFYFQVICYLMMNVWSVKPSYPYQSQNQCTLLLARRKFCSGVLWQSLPLFRATVFQLISQLQPLTPQSQASLSDPWAPEHKCYRRSVCRLAVCMEIEQWSVSPQWEWVYGVV